jgi:hypothetical protein
MPESDANALVLRPADPTARKGALLFGVIGVIGIVGLGIEIATGNVIGAVAAAIVALAGMLLAGVVVAGRSAMRVVVDASTLQIAGRRIARAEIVALRRRPISRDAGLDVVGGDDTVLYSMPGWFDAEQEQQLARALNVAIVEPPPPAEGEEQAAAEAGVGEGDGGAPPEQG